MSFWDLNDQWKQRIAVIEPDGIKHTYFDLFNLTLQKEAELKEFGPSKLGFILCNNQLTDLAVYLACLRQGHVPLLLSTATTSEQLEVLKNIYKPTWVASQGEFILEHNSPKIKLHSSLALLLSTSGTTGSPKLVRLSSEALQANAKSIATFLNLNEEERAITSLPMNYSYGLSVINSHLLVGATLVLNSDSVISRDFLNRMHEHQVTSLAGVPYTYQMLQRTAFLEQDLPKLKTLTQAGGRLNEKLTRQIYEHTVLSGRRFYVMYGQTEACARMSYVPPEKLTEKIGSIGIPIPNGSLSVDNTSGELFYKGPNVMLGYAENRDDLARGDDTKNCLPTGDIGYEDKDGFFYITGRLKRFVKISGNRIGLDELEQELEAHLLVSLAIGGADDHLVIWIESQDSNLIDRALQYMRQQFAIHHSMTNLQLVDKLPLLLSGKKDYNALLRT